MPEDFNAIYADVLEILVCHDFHLLWQGNTEYVDSVGDMDAMAMWFCMSV